MKYGKRLTRRITVTCASLAGVALCFPTSGRGGPLEDFHTLEDQLMAAHDAFVQDNQAADEGEHARTANEKNAPADPRLPILKKMDALAAANAGKDGTVRIAAGAFIWSWNLDLDLDGLPGRFDRLVEHYRDDPAFGEVLPAVAEAGMTVGKPGDWVHSLNRVVKSAKERETRLAAGFAIGQIHLAAKNLSDARAAFESVLKSGAESDYADLAKGYIFEINHLQIGMEAPDFTTTTLDGKKLSLRSLRGKAVLLNFWATW